MIANIHLAKNGLNQIFIAEQNGFDQKFNDSLDLTLQKVNNTTFPDVSARMLMVRGSVLTLIAFAFANCHIIIDQSIPENNEDYSVKVYVNEDVTIATPDMLKPVEPEEESEETISESEEIVEVPTKPVEPEEPEDEEFSHNIIGESTIGSNGDEDVKDYAIRN